MKKTTKKEIIKKMLVDELRSPAMAERLKTHPEIKIKMDLLNDDELITFSESMKDMVACTLPSGLELPYSYRIGIGRITDKPLTPKAYLLLAAYKHSLSRLCEYRKHFRHAYESALYDVARRNAWRLEYEELCGQLYCNIMVDYEQKNKPE